MLLLGLFYLILPAVQAAWLLASQPFLEVWDTANFVAGVLCFHWMLANILVTSRIPWLQRHLPWDARVRFHLYGTLGIGLTLVFHALYKIVIGKEIDLVSWSLLGLFVALVLVGCLWIPLPGVQRLRAALLKAVHRGLHHSYDWLKRFHGWLYLVLAVLMYVHIIEAELIEVVDPISAWLYRLTLGLTAAAWLWARLRRWFLPRARVVDRQLIGGIHRLTLETPRPLPFRGGQFSFLRFHTPALRGEEHPFSFLNAPGSTTLKFGIRALGDFTRRLDSLKPGDQVSLAGGFGGFFPKPADRQLCLIASGIGSVPCLSLLAQLAEEGDRRPILFFLAVDHEDEIPDPDLLASLPARLPGLQLIKLLRSQGDPEFSLDFFARHLANPADWTYFLCSSPRVRQVVYGILRRLGLRRRQIHWESFTLA